jgi:hypothetical protein
VIRYKKEKRISRYCEKKKAQPRGEGGYRLNAAKVKKKEFSTKKVE